MNALTLIKRILPATKAKSMCHACAMHGSGFGPVSQYVMQGLRNYVPEPSALLPLIESYVRPHAERELKKLSQKAQQAAIRKLLGSGLRPAGYYGGGLRPAGRYYR